MDYHVDEVEQDPLSEFVAGNLMLRRFIKKRADALERRVQDEARERMDPDRYALEEA